MATDFTKDYKDQYSPKFNAARQPPNTGHFHDWQVNHNAPYYGNAFKCSKCGKANWGWNLWREDYEPTCPGDKPKLNAHAHQAP